VIHLSQLEIPAVVVFQAEGEFRFVACGRYASVQQLFYLQFLLTDAVCFVPMHFGKSYSTVDQPHPGDTWPRSSEKSIP
jgi:hypothetical protein